MKKRNLTIVAMLILIPAFLYIYSYFPNQAVTQLKTPAHTPALLLPGLNGDTFDINKYKGKVVILNFWASWSKASRTENKNLVRIYQKYKNNSKVVFASVSLDTDETSWKTAIEEDECEWKAQFCDFKKYESPIAKAYQINTIPAFYLIDKTSTIIKTTNKVQDFEAMVDGLVK